MFDFKNFIISNVELREILIITLLKLKLIKKNYVFVMLLAFNFKALLSGWQKALIFLSDLNQILDPLASVLDVMATY
jgi:hypothetical protein